MVVDARVRADGAWRIEWRAVDPPTRVESGQAGGRDAGVSAVRERVPSAPRLADEHPAGGMSWEEGEGRYPHDRDTLTWSGMVDVSSIGGGR